MSDVHHYIDGKRFEGSSGRWGDVFNPATGEQTRRVALGGGCRDRCGGEGRGGRVSRLGPRPRR